MRRPTTFAALAATTLLLTGSCSSPTLADRFRGDEDAARQTMLELVARGPETLPQLEAALEDPDPLVKYRVRSTMGRITGQWGSDGRLLWKRSVAEAVNESKPLMVLHLFGNFDEEFC